jgi:hypothetical protein
MGSSLQNTDPWGIIVSHRKPSQVFHSSITSTSTPSPVHFLTSAPIPAVVLPGGREEGRVPRLHPARLQPGRARARVKPGRGGRQEAGPVPEGRRNRKTREEDKPPRGSAQHVVWGLQLQPGGVSARDPEQGGVRQPGQLLQDADPEEDRAQRMADQAQEGEGGRV